MLGKNIIILSTLLIFVLRTSNLYAQKTSYPKEDNDLKVGLVLSGGGAKGLAHIGVLKKIDEAGIRLDYIAGSSMGAVVGGLYASGFTGKQIDSLFYTVNFNNLIQDKLSRRRKSFYEKEDAEKYALTLPIIDGLPSLPKAISNGQNFYNFYSRVTAHVKDIKDFSKLPIPFFCTATNIETGEGIIFDKGELPDAVAASGAIPSVYSPIWYNNTLLTDGGVTDNYPIEEIKKRGAEYVIGVDVQDTLMNRSQLKSVTDIMLQISNFRTIKAMKDKVSKTDLYIRPDIQRFSVVGFNDGEDIILEGEVTANKYIDILKAISDKQNKPLPRKGVEPVRFIQLDELEINKTDSHTRSYIKGKTKLRTPCKISLEELNDGLNNLYSTKNFQNIRYQIKEDTLTKKNTISLNLNPTKTKSYLRLGLHYDDLYKTAALVNFTHKNLITKNDVISIDAILGDKLRYNIDYYVDDSYNWSTGINHRLYRYDRNLDFEAAKARRNLPDLGVNFIELEYLDITTQFYFETFFNNAFAFRIGAEQKYLYIETPTFGVDQNNVPGTLLDKVNYLGVFSTIKFDSLDDKYFPSKGVFFNTALNTYPLSTNVKDFREFAILKGKIMWAQSAGKHFSFINEASGGLRIGNLQGINPLDFFLGGYGSKEINNQVSFFGRDFFDLSGSEYLKGSFTTDFKFQKKHHFNVTANYATVSDDIFKINDIVKFRGISGYAIGYGYESLLGPVNIKYSFSPDKEEDSRLYFSIGYWF